MSHAKPIEPEAIEQVDLDGIITPELVLQLAKESEQIRKEFRKRIEKMWDIPWWERKIPCR